MTMQRTVYEVNERTQAVVFALAEDKDGVMSPSLRMALLGRDMTPLADIAVKALDDYDERRREHPAG